MNKFALVLTGMGFLGLTACQPVASPLMGVFYNETKFGYMATTDTNTSKEGKACATSIMGLVATGDASIAAAKANGGVTEVSHVDHSAKSTLGIIAEFCTIVKGK